MISGKQPQVRTAARMRRGIVASWLSATLCVSLIAGGAVLSGCGGSSSSAPGAGSATGSRVTGRVVDRYNSNRPVAGVTVRVSNSTGVTASDGTFLLDVAPRSATTLTIQGSNSVPLYNTGIVNNTLVDLRNQGISIPAVDSNQTYPTGDIVVFSQAGGPPPPPNI